MGIGIDEGFFDTDSDTQPEPDIRNQESGIT